MSDATVDILMATYNGERYVREQIESIQRQTCVDWRLLVSDDCSADGTLAVVDEMAAADPRIVVAGRGVRRGGAKENFLALARWADAPYAMFCDQDDVWLPAKVELTLAKMRELEGEAGADTPLLVFTDMKVVDSDLNVIDESFERFSNIDPSRTAFRQVLAQSVGAGCTMMMNAKLLRLLNGTAEGCFMIMHDWWATLIAAAFGRIGHVEVPTSLYRQHGDNGIGAKRFSVVSKLGALDDMRKSQYATVRQAASFLEEFGGSLSEADAAVASRYAAILEVGSPAKRVDCLAKSGAWKLGVRKAGQVVCLLGRPQ